MSESQWVFHKFADGRETGINLGRLSQMSLVDEARDAAGRPTPEAGVKVVWTDGHADVLTGQIARKVYDFVTARTIELPEEDVTVTEGGAVVRGESATTLINLLKANAVPDNSDVPPKAQASAHADVVSRPRIEPDPDAITSTKLIMNELSRGLSATPKDGRTAESLEERKERMGRELGFEVVYFGSRPFLVFEDGAVPVDKVSWIGNREGRVSIEIHPQGPIIKLTPKAAPG